MDADNEEYYENAEERLAKQ